MIPSEQYRQLDSGSATGDSSFRFTSWPEGCHGVSTWWQIFKLRTFCFTLQVAFFSLHYRRLRPTSPVAN
ncbi:hypothetical protein BaRGS_00022568 [Batillaria attramentaria]|uniref:Uncharacterized protein n=1 Tax=Batillaria attramentaria TaxID=370345 RepID=A0ABD0KGX8_9CAEN